MADIVQYYPPTLRTKYHLDNSPVPRHTADGIPSADIGWIPDYDKFKARSAEQQRNKYRESDVPKGWPAAVCGPLVRSGEDFRDECRYIFRLSPSAVEEAEAALAFVKGVPLYTA